MTCRGPRRRCLSLPLRCRGPSSSLRRVCASPGLGFLWTYRGIDGNHDTANKGALPEKQTGCNRVAVDGNHPTTYMQCSNSIILTMFRLETDSRPCISLCSSSRQDGVFRAIYVRNRSVYAGGNQPAAGRADSAECGGWHTGQRGPAASGCRAFGTRGPPSVALGRGRPVLAARLTR